MNNIAILPFQQFWKEFKKPGDHFVFLGTKELRVYNAPPHVIWMGKNMCDGTKTQKDTLIFETGSFEVRFKKWFLRFKKRKDGIEVSVIE